MMTTGTPYLLLKLCRYPTATLLPNGKIMAFGGSQWAVGAFLSLTYAPGGKNTNYEIWCVKGSKVNVWIRMKGMIE